MTLQVKILTPDKLFQDTSADEIILPTNSGQMGVLTDHAPLMTGLDVGVMLMRQQREWKSFALIGGFAYIKQNKITILVNDAEDATAIDAAEAEQTYEKARSAYDTAGDKKQKVDANITLKRARARFQAVKAVANA